MPFCGHLQRCHEATNKRNNIQQGGFMKKVLLATLLITPVIAFGKPGGIEASNYTAAFNATDTEIGNIYSLYGDIRREC
jgi:hypothetical protein